MRFNYLSMLLAVACSALGGSAAGETNADVYEPRHADDWAKVMASIRSSWERSKVDASTPQLEGSLRLPKPYFSIREGVNVLFGWDTYFTNAGLLRIEAFAPYAKNAVDNQLAEIEQVGFVPNASEPWALNRSQTPYLSMMAREVYEAGLADADWLRRAYGLLRREYAFWTNEGGNRIEDHSTHIDGLQRFGQHATDEELLVFFDVLRDRFDFDASEARAKKLEIARNWLAEAESGMDFTPRFENRAPDFIAIDLNSNLYAYERNFAWMAEELKLAGEPDWDARAEARRALVSRDRWDEERGLFVDYDFTRGRFSRAASVAAFYPLWTGLATPRQAERTAANLSRFEYAFGPTICERSRQDRRYQWDFPAGWPPIYLLVAQGLENYGFRDDARRIAAKYLDLVARNFLDPRPASIARDETKTQRQPGFVYEKYNVVTGEIYDAEYPSVPFHGWSYGVFVWCHDFLSRVKAEPDAP